MDADKLSAYQTLHTCLLTISKLMAPIAPFYADRLYKDLYSGLAKQGADSVHLDKFPVCDEALVDKALEQRMNLAQRITSMVLALRKKEHIIVRQPLQKIAVPIADQQIKEAISLVKQLILDEVNVKELQFVEGDMISKKVKCNFRVMGKKFGKMMKAVAAAVAELSQEDIVRLEKEGMLQLVVDNQNVSIEREDVEIVSEDMPGWTVEHDGTITVALDLTISDELKREGLAREVVKRIQTYRKESGFEITDRITVVFSDNETLKAAVEEHKEYIAAQVLANEIRFADITSDTTFDFDTFKVDVDITKN
ncbi:MAG: class I tRNA ligase family protein, partial [Bacteroidaceae bacterium]|nr:class I tRNA ligase family protein [Bacteroidaceae bacterium]